MNAIAAPKSHRLNLLEGMMLTAIFQGVPTFASAVLLLKVAGSHAIIADKGGAAIFVALATIFFTLLMTWLGPKFPRFFKTYEPLFYDATLPIPEKLARWRIQPAVSLQQVTQVMLMSLLAVAVVSVG